MRERERGCLKEDNMCKKQGHILREISVEREREQRSPKTRINLLYSIYPDRKHCFGIEKNGSTRLKWSIFGWGDIVQIS